MKKLCFALLAALSITLNLSAELWLPSILTDHMVLQRGQAVPIWGTAEPGSRITVEFNGQSPSTTAGAEGKWQVDLDSMPANATPQTMTITSSKDGTIEIRDVLIGEVWLAGGQSNMQFQMRLLKDAEAVIASSANPLIRIYITPTTIAPIPKAHIDAAWAPCNPQTLSEFSAVAYYFSKKLQEELDVPIGLLESCWGGSLIEAWTPPGGFEGLSSLAGYRKQIQRLQADSGKPKWNRQSPTSMFNAMIYAHIPYAIKGAIWYQGEANHIAQGKQRKPAMLYRDKSEALIKGWRTLWGYDFPFYFVQLTPFDYQGEDPFLLPEFWEAQAEVVKTIPNTGMTVVSDAATPNNIHPPNKEVPGTRLALLALDHSYGKDIVSTGPTFKDMVIGDGRIEVLFDAADGLTTRDGEAPDWFELVGDEGFWKPADAVIQGNSVLLSSPEIDQPVAMRFAWHKLAMPNLINAAGLPAPAFRAGEAPEPDISDRVQLPENDYGVDLGIGNSAAHPRSRDWSLAYNGDDYYLRRLTVFLK